MGRGEGTSGSAEGGQGLKLARTANFSAKRLLLLRKLGVVERLSEQGRSGGPFWECGGAPGVGSGILGFGKAQRVSNSTLTPSNTIGSIPYVGGLNAYSMPTTVFKHNPFENGDDISILVVKNHRTK